MADKLHFLMQLVGSAFFVMEPPLGERTPNEKSMDMLQG